MAEESFTQRVCGVVARGNEDSVPRIAVHKHDEELLSVVGGKRSHNIYGERVPRPSGLNGLPWFLGGKYVGAHLLVALDQPATG